MKELKFLTALWKANLQSAMEYRASFLSQMLGMIINNGMYFIIWVIFFDRFQNVRGWGLSDMYITFGVTASSFGLVSILFGNVFFMGEIISQGRLDYYLSLPRPVLLHTLASRTIASGLGDFTYGFLSFGFSGAFSWDSLLRFIVAVILSAAVFTAFMIIIQSLTFWIGSSVNLISVASNAMITFAIYPITLFDNTTRLILFTLIPAAFMGAVPASFTRSFSLQTLILLTSGAFVFLSLAAIVFQKGLKRYESGSGIQIEI